MITTQRLLMMLLLMLLLGTVVGQRRQQQEAMAFSEDTANGVRREGIDTSLRKYAFLALNSRQQQRHVHTGVIYNVSLPPSLDGIDCQVMRVRAGSARRRGLVFNEFRLPQGVLVRSGGPFVVLVYRKILNFTLYSPPAGYAFATPIVGIVAYTSTSTSNFTESADHQEMSLVSPTSMSIQANLTTSIFSQYDYLTADGSSSFSCAFFDINGTSSITSPTNYNTSARYACSSKTLMDVALLLPTSVDAPVASPDAATLTSASSSPLHTCVYLHSLIVFATSLVLILLESLVYYL